MMYMKHFLVFPFFLLLSSGLFAQENNFIQFSGLVESADSSGQAVPYATVYDVNSGLLVMANYEGFFSIVVSTGDTLQFSSVGFSTHRIFIPSAFTGEKISLRIYLYPEVAMLPLVKVFPWGGREN